MSFIDSIRRRFFERVLKQRNAKPQRTIVNLNDAKTIGIIYDSSFPDHDIIITKFSEMLRNKGKTVEVLAYINDKKVDHKGDIQIFNPKSVNWYGIPQDDRVTAFTNKNFDLMIYAVLDEVWPLEYIAFMSKAKYRVGPFNEKKTYCSDLMIQMGDKKDLSYLLQQMVHFLENIKYN